MSRTLDEMEAALTRMETDVYKAHQEIAQLRELLQSVSGACYQLVEWAESRPFGPRKELLGHIKLALRRAMHL